MHLKHMFTILIILIAITGCTTKKEVVKEEKTINELDYAPTWVKSPQEENYISAVGNSKAINKTFNAQRDEAIEDAKANLSYKLSKKINNIFSLIGKNYTDDKVFVQNVTDANNEIVSNAINESRVMKLWKSDKSNIYVMVSSKIPLIQKDLKAVIDTTFKDYPNLQSEYRLNKEQGKIYIELKN